MLDNKHDVLEEVLSQNLNIKVKWSRYRPFVA